MARVRLLCLLGSLTLAAFPVWAHPHGSASCAVEVGYKAGSVSQVKVTLELDAEHSREAFEAMQAKTDGSVTAAQRARMASNLHQLFAPLNYLVTVTSNRAGVETEIGLRPSSTPQIERSAKGRLLVTALLERPAPIISNENEISFRCADPSWHWLVGFKTAAVVSQNRRCTSRLGDPFVFALPANLPTADGPSLKVTDEHLPKSQLAYLRCE
jgi:ABC-type uncharacterized transport system substrate-binding protein